MIYKLIFSNVKWIILGIVLFNQSFLTLAQNNAYRLPDKLYKENTVGYYWSFTTEYDFNYNYNLSTVLQNVDYPSFGEQPELYGISLMGITNRFVYDVGAGINYRKKRIENAYAKQNMNSFHLHFGFDLLKNPMWSIFPYVGARVNLMKYTYRESRKEPYSLEEYVEEGPENFTLKYSKIYLDCGIGFSNQKIHRVEVRAGYNVPISKNKWWDAGRQNEIQGISPYVTGWYVRVSVGIGTIYKD